MKYKKLAQQEAGYLLVESLFTLIILLAVTIVLCPLAIHWLSIYREAQILVEESRILYESSIHLQNEQVNPQSNEAYIIEINKKQIRINGTGTEVVIYESIFEKE